MLSRRSFIGSMGAVSGIVGVRSADSATLQNSNASNAFLNEMGSLGVIIDKKPNIVHVSVKCSAKYNILKVMIFYDGQKPGYTSLDVDDIGANYSGDAMIADQGISAVVVIAFLQNGRMLSAKA